MKPDWNALMTEERDMLLLANFSKEENAHLSGRAAARLLVSNVTGGGLIVYCRRANIPLPTTAYGQKYYERLRRDTARGRGRLVTLRRRFAQRGLLIVS